MERRNWIRRNIYICEGCTMKTLPCVMCEHGMTRGGMLLICH
jgi:hypothetical protein